MAEEVDNELEIENPNNKQSAILKKPPKTIPHKKTKVQEIITRKQEQAKKTKENKEINRSKNKPIPQTSTIQTKPKIEPQKIILPEEDDLYSAYKID